MFCAVCRIDGNATGRTVEGTGNAGRRTLAPMCPADRDGTAGGCRCAHGKPSPVRRTVSGEIGHGERLPDRSPRQAGTQQGARQRAQERGGRSGQARTVRRTGTPRRTLAAPFPAMCPHRVRLMANCPNPSPSGRVSGEIVTGGTAYGGGRSERPHRFNGKPDAERLRLSPVGRGRGGADVILHANRRDYVRHLRGVAFCSGAYAGEHGNARE